MQSASVSHTTALHSVSTKLDALPRQQAGQFMTAYVSMVTLSSKQGVDSCEQVREGPSQVTDSLKDGALGLVFSSVA
jgi:hypothetical protein